MHEIGLEDEQTAYSVYLQTLNGTKRAPLHSVQGGTSEGPSTLWAIDPQLVTCYEIDK